MAIRTGSLRTWRTSPNLSAVAVRKRPQGREISIASAETGAMIAYLSDRANAVTAVGILCSGAAMGLVARGHQEAGVALGLWAIIADDVDGEIARRTKNRTMATKAIGKALDAFPDLIFGQLSRQLSSHLSSICQHLRYSQRS
ncbi:CDP-alcohol phosphatidyltransferase family protein [Bradyrhizobium sp. NBAIM20]|uniref:CDP-alcohol phosphatidyltransferase family protein n=1 Tax=unclassified Bradyrhizobium TaxID=2631580 RepID=UPI001CD69E09|nr:MULTISPECIES: CDP-alcohol phosphatidyltransferase family protein [unclassified Bradyrhizobium]MCA1415485.1 CDP-alcohol phosphatidyltransferase family protein [Bradyrhizobium sp. NBAIM20]MCA1460891.1 CDP-alcohol phosphatidyltransferase family protein [Bradyrhizobium sp. NBAIM18]